MKKKILLVALMVAILTCIFAISVSADALTNYASVELTFVDGTTATGYCKIDGRFLRDDIYKNPEKIEDGVYAWGDIKVFDMRNSVIVGTKTYNEVGGLNCNNQAVNVEEYYFSSQVTKILNTTFTSGWKKLKTVYVPNTVTVIDDTAFKESPVQQVVFEEGSQLQSIGRSAFEKCANLTTITLPDGLQSLGYNCFWDSGLSGTVVIPNSVTKLEPGSLLSTKIENLYLGDGALEIGHNFLGTYQNTNNQYLKNVYISASTTFTAGNIFFKCANPVNFYVVGTKEECDAVVATLKSQSTGNYMTFITANEVTENTGAGYGIIHTEYNRCDAFYNKEHLTAEQTYDFTSFLEKSYVRSACSRCEQGTVLKEIAPLFTCLGYSAFENGNGEFSLNFRVDNEAIKDYITTTGKTVSYGLFATTKNAIGDKDIVSNDGKLADGAVMAEIPFDSFVALTIKMGGFDTDELKKSEFAIGAYVAEDNGEGKKYTYLQNEKPQGSAKYSFVSYNNIVA